MKMYEERCAMLAGRAAFRTFRDNKFSFASEKKNPHKKGTLLFNKWQYGWAIEQLIFNFDPERVPPELFRNLQQMQTGFIPF